MDHPKAGIVEKARKRSGAVLNALRNYRGIFASVTDSSFARWLQNPTGGMRDRPK